MVNLSDKETTHVKDPRILRAYKYKDKDRVC